MWSSVQNPVIQKNIAFYQQTHCIVLWRLSEIFQITVFAHWRAWRDCLHRCRRTVQSVKRITWKTCWKPGKKINTYYCDCHTVLLMLKGDLCARLRRSRYWLRVKSPLVSFSAFTETDVGVSSYFHLKSQSNLNGPRDFIHHTQFFSIFVPLKRGIKKWILFAKIVLKSSILVDHLRATEVESSLLVLRCSEFLLSFFFSPLFLSLFPPPSLSLIIHRLARRPHSPRMLTDSSSSRAVAGY